MLGVVVSLDLVFVRILFAETPNSPAQLGASIYRYACDSFHKSLLKVSEGGSSHPPPHHHFLPTQMTQCSGSL